MRQQHVPPLQLLPPLPPLRLPAPSLAYLRSGVPAGWAAPNSFTRLRVASLADNPLGGPLPSEWGASAGALPKLQRLDLASAGLSGTLPDWGTGLQSLQDL